MKKIFYILIFTIYLYSCSNYQASAFGERDVIDVIIDDSIYIENKYIIEEILWNTRYYPSFEHVFDINLVDAEKFWEKRTDYWRRHNLLIISDKNPNSPIYDIVKDVVGEEEGIFFYKNLWANPQIVCFIIKEKNKLNEFLKDNSDQIFNGFFNSLSERIEYMLYKGEYQIAVEDFMQDKYNLSIKLPLYYLIADTGGNQDSGYFIAVQHMRSGTHNAVSRYISVFWEIDTNQNINLENIENWRNNLSKLHFINDVLKISDSSEDSLGIVYEGIWQNSSLQGGGPWRGWIQKDEDRIILIETHLFAPGNKKSFYFEELRLIAKTFSNIQ